MKVLTKTKPRRTSASTYGEQSPRKISPNVLSFSPSDVSSADDQSSSNYQGQSSLTEWLTTEEAAQYLKVSVGSIRNMTSNGKIPYYKFDRRNRYRLDDLRQLLLKNPRGGFYGN